jgi:hypothetical protein
MGTFMRMATKASRIRILIVTICILLFGSALAAESAWSHASAGAAAPSADAGAPSPADLVTVIPPDHQVIAELPAQVSLQIKANDSNSLTLTYSATGLPPGLTISTTGLISGTITTAYTGQTTVTVTDGVASGNAKFTWIAKNGIVVNAPVKEQSWVRIPISVQVSAVDVDFTQTLTYSATGLPAGLTINANTGLISGTPRGISVVTATVTATDLTGSASSAAIRWAVGWAVTIPDPGKVTTTVGQAVNVPITYTNGAGPSDRVTLWAVGLPRGVSFKQYASGPSQVYGWPTAVGTYKVTIRSKGSMGDVDWMTFPLVARPAPNSGPTGQIHLALGGKCLNDPGNRTGNGTRVTISNCQAVPAERWTVASDGTIRVHNHCLDIAGQGGAAGQPVQLWQCTGGAREIWLQGTAGELVNPASGLCLTGLSTKPTMGACHIRKSEAWTLPAQPVLASVTGKCVDDHFSGAANGNIIDTFSCNGTAGQAWTFEPDGTLRMFSNKCVTVLGPVGRVSAKVGLWDCTAAKRKAQQWAVVRTGDLSAELTLGGVCLAIPSMTAADGSQLRTARCTATDPRVHWHIW